jgi:hypothetical protein
VDRAIKQKYPDIGLHSNDISLLTVMLGRLLMHQAIEFTFNGRLQFIEDYLGDKASDESRISALIVSMDMAKYAGKNSYNASHFNHYVINFEAFHEKGLKWVEKFTNETIIDHFYAGDFRDHAEHATGKSIVVAFPPTYKGGYEKLYKFIDENTSWASPEYRMFDPKDLKDWMDDMGAKGQHYCVFSDQLFDDLARVAEYYGATNKPVYVYANCSNDSSLRRNLNRAEPFGYEAVDPDALRHDTDVKLVPMQGVHMNYLKDIYLAKNIHHSSGMFNYAVFLDGKLAGGFIMALSKFGDIENLYMLSDFSITRERKISKLIAMLATCHEVHDPIGVRMLMNIKGLFTTAFTDAPISMKYRGIYELINRKAGHLQYYSAIRQQTPRHIFTEWFKKEYSKGQTK